MRTGPGGEGGTVTGELGLQENLVCVDPGPLVKLVQVNLVLSCCVAGNCKTDADSSPFLI